MSQRGSFVTEYIYCDKCFQAAKSVLLRKDSELCSVVVPSWTPSEIEMPVIAGKLGHFCSEADLMEYVIGPDLEDVICHPIRIAVLEECGMDEELAARTIVIKPRPA